VSVCLVEVHHSCREYFAMMPANRGIFGCAHKQPKITMAHTANTTPTGSVFEKPETSSRTHVVLALFFIELAFLFRSCILVLLIF